VRGLLHLKLRVLDLYSGAEGWSQAFKDRGHYVVSVDWDPRFKPTICADISQLTAVEILRLSFSHLIVPEISYEKLGFDVVLASPDCRPFSMLAIRHYWHKNEPKPVTRKAIALVRHTLSLIRDLNPRFWVLENPRGMLRTVLGKPATTVTYCQYGTPYQKPTDLWGELPPSFKPKRCRKLDPCHESTPRGQNTRGLKGYARAESKKTSWTGRGGNWEAQNKKMNSDKRSVIASKIPYKLSLDVCIAAEKDVEAGRSASSLLSHSSWALVCAP